MRIYAVYQELDLGERYFLHEKDAEAFCAKQNKDMQEAEMKEWEENHDDENWFPPIYYPYKYYEIEVLESLPE
jgi:hypothetical protein